MVAVEHVAAPYLHLGCADGLQVALPLGVGRAPAPGGHVVQQRVVAQVLGAEQRWTAFEQAWRAHREDLLFQQHGALEAGVAAVVEVDREVELAVAQRVRAVLGLDLQLDLRKARHQARQTRDQPGGEEGGQGAHPYHAAERAATQAADGELDRGVGRIDRGEQALARVGELEPARQAAEQALGEPVLEQLDLLAHRAGGDAELLAGAGEGQVTRDGEEDA